MNYKHCCVIDEAGYYQTFVLVLLPEDAEPQVQGYKLKSGESLVDAAPPSTRPYAGTTGLVKPLWDGTAWTEGATDEEIAVWETENPGKGLTLADVQDQRIAESKTALAEYLEFHPLTWTDGKQYSVTEDKQALLTGNLAAYQLAVTLGQTNPELTWNATGEECTVWTFENLAMLAIAIKAYVKPLVAYQQKTEIAIRACTTVEDVEAVAIDYEAAS